MLTVECDHASEPEVLWSFTLLDDSALGSLQEHGRRNLLDILEDRTGERSTIFSSQLPPAK